MSSLVLWYRGRSTLAAAKGLASAYRYRVAGAALASSLQGNACQTTWPIMEPFGTRGLATVPRIDVARYILVNYKPYDGDDSFLAGATSRTQKVWDKCVDLLKAEHEKGVLDCDYKTPASILSHPPGYIDRELDLIVGLQTDAPLKRMIKPKGGWRMVEAALTSYGYPVDEHLKDIFT